MKAVVVNRLARSDAPDIPLFIDSELPNPEVKPYDLLVRVEAIAVNPVDLKMARAKQSPQSLDRVLGWDVAGVVVGMGADVVGFKQGDEVFYAGSVQRPGGYSALHAVDARLVGLKPKTLSFIQAAALPLCSLAAWQLGRACSTGCACTGEPFSSPPHCLCLAAQAAWVQWLCNLPPS